MKNYSSYQQIRADLVDGKITCTGLVQHYLDRIDKLNPSLNAFLEVFSIEALKKAKVIDTKFSAGTAGKLAGLVVGIKDLFCYEGHTVTCSSKILEGFESLITATAVQRLLDEDAIIIGRQNCDEFAMGSSNENSAYSIVRNADDLNKVPGGSSGGSAVAVQANLCQVSLGSDTGGSIRQPASFCGIFGLKPTYSRISRYGLTAYSSSFDCVGILAKSIEDCALTLQFIAGADENDSTSSRQKVPIYTSLLNDSKKYKIAYQEEIHNAEGVSLEVRQTMENAFKVLEKNGHSISKVKFPFLDYLLPTYYILTSAEASANLARYDGVRYGYRHVDQDLDTMIKRSRTDGFGPEVLRRIILGTFVLSAGYHDAFYTKAQKVRQMIKKHTDETLEKYDFIIMPTTPTTAFHQGDKTDDPIQMYLSDLFTVQASVSGIPAISIPLDRDSSGMAIGIQLMTKKFEESSLLAITKELQESYLKA